jgi:hypothetical protein
VSEPRPGLRIVEQPSYKGPYEELAGIAQALGVAHHGARVLEVSVNGATVTFELEINSGSVVGLRLKLLPEGPVLPDSPSISLRAEREDERAGKRRGIAVEVQLGDDRFDEAVYVDSDATDGEVKRVLASPGVRAAARDLLLRGCETVRLSRRFVEVKWTLKKDLFDGPRMLTDLQSVLTLASAGGPRAQAPAPRGGAVVAFTFLALVGALPYLVVVLALPAHGGDELLRARRRRSRAADALERRA